MARSVEDVSFLDTVFNTCGSPARPSAALEGLRVGYATNWWRDIGEEASSDSDYLRSGLLAE